MEPQKGSQIIDKSTIINFVSNPFDEAELELLLKSYPDLNAQSEEVTFFVKCTFKLIL